MATDAGRWVEDPVLPEIPAPPADRVEVSGARLLRVLNVDAHNPSSRGGYTDVVALAWTVLPDGGRGVLAAWQGAWQQGVRTSGAPRCGWCRVLEDRTVVVEQPPRIAGMAWHGWHEDSAVGVAVRRAAQLLPAELREAALTPAAPPSR